VSALRVGTRGSELARAQASWVAARLPEPVEIVVVAVSGDADPARPAPAPAGPSDKTRWVDRIEQALGEGSIDLAVHSAKDVPGTLAPGLELVAATAREDARDALCGAGGLDELPPGARVGTGSIRRAAQLRAERADLDVRDLRGNVPTRLRRLADGDFDAIVLALAGLDRLGRREAAGAPLPLDRFVPAPGQGILALEGRSGDDRARAYAAAVNDPRAWSALAAERALVAALDASCHTPVGAHARPAGAGELVVDAFVGLPDGSAWVRDRLSGPAGDPAALGREVARRLLAAGAGELLRAAEELAGARA